MWRSVGGLQCIHCMHWSVDCTLVCVTVIILTHRSFMLRISIDWYRMNFTVKRSHDFIQCMLSRNSPIAKRFHIFIVLYTSVEYWDRRERSNHFTISIFYDSINPLLSNSVTITWSEFSKFTSNCSSAKCQHDDGRKEGFIPTFFSLRNGFLHWPSRIKAIQKAKRVWHVMYAKEATCISSNNLSHSKKFCWIWTDWKWPVVWRGRGLTGDYTGFGRRAIFKHDAAS